MKEIKKYTIDELTEILIKKGFKKIEAEAFIFDCINFKPKLKGGIKWKI